MYPEMDVDRPVARGECVGPGVCPFIACKHHLYLDVNEETGSIKINFPDLEVWEMADTCALDVADRGGITLEEVGEIVNLTRERIRQVEVQGLLKLKMAMPDPEGMRATLGHVANRQDLDDRYTEAPGGAWAVMKGLVKHEKKTGVGGTPKQLLAALGPGEKTSSQVASVVGGHPRQVGLRLRELEREGVVASRRERRGTSVLIIWRRAG